MPLAGFMPNNMLVSMSQKVYKSINHFLSVEVHDPMKRWKDVSGNGNFPNHIENIYCEIDAASTCIWKEYINNSLQKC